MRRRAWDEPPGRPDRLDRLCSASLSASIKAKLGTLVVVSVFITTGLLIVALRTETELRFITVFSVIATLLITQFVAHGLTAPLDEMNTVAKGISHGDYTRRVSGADRRDELGDLASTINRMADDLEAVDRHRKELVANVSHELRTPIAALRAVLENVVDGVSAADPETMRTALKQTERLGRLVETLLDLSRLDNGVVPLKARRFEVWPYLSGVLKEANLAASQRRLSSGLGQPHPYGRPSAPGRLAARADRARGRGTAAPGGRQSHRQRGQAQPAARPGHGTGAARAAAGVAGAGGGRRGPGHPGGGAPPGLRALQPRQPPPRTARAATAVRGWGWRSPAGRWICTAAASAWPNPPVAAESRSPFRESLSRAVDVGFEPEAAVLRAVREGHTGRKAVSRGLSHPRRAEPCLFPAISCAETRLRCDVRDDDRPGLHLTAREA